MNFRKGAIGALMDELERATLELRMRIDPLSLQTYEHLMDPATEDENCRSIQTIISHVVSSGYSYADYLRTAFGIKSSRPPYRMLPRAEVLPAIDAMLEYTTDTLENKWEMPEEQIVAVRIHSRWGVDYDMEQLLEHAIVHVLRHRRQIDKFLKAHDSSSNKL